MSKDCVGDIRGESLLSDEDMAADRDEALRLRVLRDVKSREIQGTDRKSLQRRVAVRMQDLKSGRV